MMRIYLLLAAIILGIQLNHAQAQRKSKHKYLKNNIQVYYNAALSKTKLRRMDVPSSGWFNTLARFEENTNPVYGFNYGLEFARRISKKTTLGIGIGYEEKGEISDPISINNPGNPNSANVLSLYKYKLQSYQIPLSVLVDGFGFIVLGKQINTVWGGMIVGDIYAKFNAQNYLRFIDSGEQRQGGSSERLFYHRNKWTNFKQHLTNGYIRVGIGALGGCHIDISKHLFARVLIDYTYYTEPIKKHDFLIKGTAWLLGLKMSAGINF